MEMNTNITLDELVDFVLTDNHLDFSVEEVRILNALMREKLKEISDPYEKEFYGGIINSLSDKMSNNEIESIKYDFKTVTDKIIKGKTQLRTLGRTPSRSWMDIDDLTRCKSLLEPPSFIRDHILEDFSNKSYFFKILNKGTSVKMCQVRNYQDYYDKHSVLDFMKSILNNEYVSHAKIGASGTIYSANKTND